MGLRRHLHCVFFLFFFFFHFLPFHSLSVFTYLLLTSACFQHWLSFGFPPNEAEDCDSSAFPPSPLTPLTYFTKGVFFSFDFSMYLSSLFLTFALFLGWTVSRSLNITHSQTAIFSALC